MATLQEQISEQEASLAALKQRAVNESEAPVSRQFVEDVLNGVAAMGGEPNVDCVNMKAKGITTGIDAVDGGWVTITLPTNTATGDVKALLLAQYGILTSPTMKGERIDPNEDAGPIVIRLNHLKAARWIYDSEKTFA